MRHKKRLKYNWKVFIYNKEKESLITQKAWEYISTNRLLQKQKVFFAQRKSLGSLSKV